MFSLHPFLFLSLYSLIFSHYVKLRDLRGQTPMGLNSRLKSSVCCSPLPSPSLSPPLSSFAFLSSPQNKQRYCLFCVHPFHTHTHTCSSVHINLFVRVCVCVCVCVYVCSVCAQQEQLNLLLEYLRKGTLAISHHIASNQCFPEKETEMMPSCKGKELKKYIRA